ncbi:flagellar protein FlgN [Novosphingobium sp.]|uniref:flagellar protein FlgN n=1 Tax=Novosphingobium sp. TaxID=1874826 RepID=UPI00352B1495
MSHEAAVRPIEMRDTLRQMVAVLQKERHALAGLDVDAIMGCAVDKGNLCGRLSDASPELVDEECRGLLDAARRLNEANRRVRNLIASNVSARLDAMVGAPTLYNAHRSTRRLNYRA